MNDSGATNNFKKLIIEDKLIMLFYLHYKTLVNGQNNSLTISLIHTHTSII